MKSCFLNLPSPRKLIRRFTCSYYASNFLFPPMELLSLAAIVTEWKKAEAVVIDAVAEQIDLQQVLLRLRQSEPDVLVFMAGIETIVSDLKQVEEIKQALPGLKIVALGYLPTQFPREILEKASFIDFILLNEPEAAFSELYDRWCSGGRLEEVAGLAGRVDGQVFVGAWSDRRKNLDDLPLPARELTDRDRYYEFLSPRPFTTIQSSRGCPAACTYCIRTFGQKVGFRSVESLIAEIRECVARHGVRTIRFIDDNFCMDRRRIEDLCRRIIVEGISFQWSCLSRVDSLDESLLTLMKQAGCFRIYLGIETFSKRILEFYQKGCLPQKVIPLIEVMSRLGIESMGFFMIGGIQTREEFEQDVTTACRIGLDYIAVEKVIPYPGTPLFEEMKDQIEFSLFPYCNRLKDSDKETMVYAWEREFYRRFYLRPGYVLRMGKRLLRYPSDIWTGGRDVLRYSWRKADLSAERADLI